MTIQECREYLPNGWTEIIQQDPLLMEIFEEHRCTMAYEAVPPFLIQSLRGGNIEHLRPILALYGKIGLELLEKLLEIDEISKDTAVSELPNGEIAYAGYFFTRFSDENRQAAERAVRTYIKDINRVFVEEFEEDAPLDENAEIEFLFGQAAREFEEEVYQKQVKGEDNDIKVDLSVWCCDMPYRKGYEGIGLMSEALYHISCDFLLSYYLQWSAFDTEQENPFRSYFELWKMGVTVHFPECRRVVLLG